MPTPRPAGRPTLYGRTGACRPAQSATTATPNVQHNDGNPQTKNARMNEPGMARGQAPFPSEWLGRIRIWQWPLGRHSQQISRTAVSPFNHGDGDQSHFAAGSTSKPDTDIKEKKKMALLMQGESRVGLWFFRFQRLAQHKHNNVEVTSHILVRFDGTQV